MSVGSANRRLWSTFLRTALTVTIATVFWESSAESSDVRYGNVIGLKDVTISHDVIFTSQRVRSRLDCARLCASHCCCDKFTHTVTSAGQYACQGHSASSAVTATTSSPGSETFQSLAQPVQSVAPWVNGACTADSDCPAAQSACYSGQCLCTIGLYYSTGSKTCIAACPQSQLGSDFMTYATFAVWGTYVYYNSSMELNACYDVARNDAQGRVIIYDGIAKNCYIDYGTWTEASSGQQKIDLGGWSYLQKTCA